MKLHTTNKENLFHPTMADDLRVVFQGAAYDVLLAHQIVAERGALRFLVEQSTALPKHLGDARAHVRIDYATPAGEADETGRHWKKHFPRADSLDVEMHGKPAWYLAAAMPNLEKFLGVHVGMTECQMGWFTPQEMAEKLRSDISASMPNGLFLSVADYGQDIPGDVDDFYQYRAPRLDDVLLREQRNLHWKAEALNSRKKAA